MLQDAYILIALICGLGIVGGPLVIYTRLSERGKGWKRTVTISVIVMVISICVMTYTLANKSTITNQESKKYSLIALQDTYDEDMDIKLKLFAIKVDNQEKTFYRFYYQDENGDIHFKEMNVGDVTLVYTDGPAYYEVIKSVTETQTSTFGPKTTVFTDESYTYKLHIPVGSITAGIEIDMED